MSTLTLKRFAKTNVPKPVLQLLFKFDDSMRERFLGYLARGPRPMTKPIGSSTEEITGLSGRRLEAEPHSPTRVGESRSPRLRRAAFWGLLAVSLLAWAGVIWLAVIWLGQR
jgi:hypothetical protein